MGDTREKSIACLILAAGFGSRIKSLGLKPLLTYKNKPFVQIIAENAQNAGFSPLVCVANHLNESKIAKLNLSLKILKNPSPENGMFSSVKIGVQFLAEFCSGILITPVDFPLVKCQTYEKLFAEFQKRNQSILIPSFDNRAGHPIIIPRQLFPLIQESKPSITLRDVISLKSEFVEYLEVSDPAIHFNINSEQAYQRYCAEKY